MGRCAGAHLSFPPHFLDFASLSRERMPRQTHRGAICQLLAPEFLKKTGTWTFEMHPRRALRGTPFLDANPVSAPKRGQAARASLGHDVPNTSADQRHEPRRDSGAHPYVPRL